MTLKNVKTGQSISEVPELAISTAPKRRLLAAGSEARTAAAGQAAEVVNPFVHPRSLVSDFTSAELLVTHQLRRLLGRSFLALSPCVVMHPMVNPQGGFTQVERRAFREMALGAGAAKVFVWTGRPLTDQEVLSRQAPSGGCVGITAKPVSSATKPDHPMPRCKRSPPNSPDRFLLLASMLVCIVVSACAGAIGVKLSSEIEYRTETGESIHARYYRLNDGSLSFAKIRLPGGSEATLPNVLSASGAKYSDGRRYTWWTKGNTAFLEVRGSDGTWQLRYRDCVAIQR